MAEADTIEVLMKFNDRSRVLKIPATTHDLLKNVEHYAKTAYDDVLKQQRCNPEAIFFQVNSEEWGSYVDLTADTVDMIKHRSVLRMIHDEVCM